MLYILLALLVIDSAFAIIFKAHSDVLVTSLVALGIAVLLAISVYFFAKQINLLKSKTSKTEKLDIVELSNLDKSTKLVKLGIRIGTLFELLRSKLKVLFTEIRNTAVDNSAIVRNTTNFSKKFGEIGASVKTVNISIQNVSSAVEELNASIEEISSSSQTLAKSAQDLSETANNVSDKASKGERALRESETKMNDFKIKVKHISEQAGKLVNYFNLINQAVTVISNISDQTNLLALNAAIEAARAGETGKGFAVVADEIRKLAEESKNAALKIGDNLKDVTSEIREISQNIFNLNEQLESILKGNEETTSMVISILDSVTSMNSSISGIAASSEELSASSEEMAAASKNITDMSMEVSKMTETIEENVNEVSSKLKDIIQNVQKSMEETQKVVEGLASYTIYSKAEFADLLQDAINAHKSWLNKLEEGVQNEKVVDLETDPKRCNFGIVISSVMPPDEIKEEWKNVENFHSNVHEYGLNVIKALESKNISDAQENLAYAQSNANKLIEILEALKLKLKR